MLNQNLGTDGDKNKTTEKLGAQLAGYAATKTDAKHQTHHRQDERYKTYDADGW